MILFRNENSFFNYKYIDAVYIASPVSHHVSHSTKAAKKGIHILCEVPAFQKIAEGKIWSSEEAKDLNLIDEIGSQRESLNRLAELSNIKEYSVELIEEDISIFDQIG